MKQYDYIDALRGWAIVLVLFVHSYNYFDNGLGPWWFYNITYIGNFGVMLFFIVSSLTLLSSLSQRHNEEKHPIVNYFIRRYFRIAPLFYVSIGLCYLFRDMPFDFQYVMINFLLLFGFLPNGYESIVPFGWTIGIEIIFYMLLPILFNLIKSVKKALLLITISYFLYFLSKYIIYPRLDLMFPNHTNWYVSFISIVLNQKFMAYMPIFLLGFILYFYSGFDESCRKEYKWLLVFVALLYFIAKLVLPTLIEQELLFSIFFCFLIIYLRENKNAFLVNTFLVEIGKLSFSIYLLHSFSFKIIHYLQLDHVSNSVILNTLIRFILIFGVTYVFAKISYTLIEKNGIKFGKLLINKIERKQAS